MGVLRGPLFLERYMPFLNAGVDDPRPELKKFRRGTLKKICLEAGLEFDGNVATADDLRRMVSSNNLDVGPYMSEQHKLGNKEAPSKAIRRVEKEKEVLEERIADLEEKFMELLTAQASSKEKAAEQDEFPENFEGLPIWRLRQLAKTCEIKCTKTDKAVDIIRKLNEYTAERRQ